MATATRDPQILGPDDEIRSGSSDPHSSISVLEEADRSHQIATARRYPRSVTNFVKELTELACLSQETAMAMMFSLPRAGKQIVGPSVRFAEAALSCWGNARAGCEVIDVDKKDGVVTAEGRYYDCEKNVGIALRKRRRIVAKTVNADSIQVTGDAINSIAYRDAILRGIPQAIWKPIWERAKTTAAGDAKSIQAIREGLLQRFRTLGVTDLSLFNALSVNGPADLGPDQIVALQAWLKQLNEGECTLEDIFGSPLDEEIESLMDKLQWPATKKRMSRESYKGRREEHLAYLRKMCAELGQPASSAPAAAADAKAAQAKEASAAEPVEGAPADGSQPAEGSAQQNEDKSRETRSQDPPAAKGKAKSQKPLW